MGLWPGRQHLRGPVFNIHSWVDLWQVWIWTCSNWLLRGFDVWWEKAQIWTRGGQGLPWHMGRGGCSLPSCHSRLNGTVSQGLTETLPPVQGGWGSLLNGKTAFGPLVLQLLILDSWSISFRLSCPTENQSPVLPLPTPGKMKKDPWECVEWLGQNKFGEIF